MTPTPVTYTGVTRYVSACFDGEGNVLVENGYNTIERTRIVATGFRDNGVVQEFRGRLVLVFQPTAAGERAGCEPDRIVATFFGERL